MYRLIGGVGVPDLWFVGLVCGAVWCSIFGALG